MARSWTDLKAIPLTRDVIDEINAKVRMESEMMDYLRSGDNPIEDEVTFLFAVRDVEYSDTVLLGTPEETRLTKLIEAIEAYRSKCK